MPSSSLTSAVGSTERAGRTIASAREPELPPWAQVSERRRGHIVRVTALLDEWARQLDLTSEEARAWHDAGRWHDALRDAPEEELRRLLASETGGGLPSTPTMPAEMLHGPAAAARLVREGERRLEVIEAIRWHTVGHPRWGRVGRALYMADYLEPGRKFSPADRAFLASHLAHDFDGVFRQVVRHRLEWSLRDGKPLFSETVALWNAVR